MFSVGAYNAHTTYHTHVCDFEAFYIICEVMFAVLGYLGEFLDLSNWGYKYYYTAVTEPRFQCVVKTGSNYQILSVAQEREK
jgi:hypothetical protein